MGMTVTIHAHNVICWVESNLHIQQTSEMDLMGR